MSTLVKATPSHGNNAGELQTIRTSQRVTVSTPAGVVYITYDSEVGAVIVVKGEKATTTVKFNEKAVV